MSEPAPKIPVLGRNEYTPSEQAQIDKGFTLHACGNFISNDQIHCQYCKGFNNKTKAGFCPTCKQALPPG